MNKLVLPLSVVLAFELLAGCVPRKLHSGAENVHLYDSRAPKSCKYLGAITNPSVHGDLNLSSSVADLQKDDINFLKNEGAKLGANMVVLVSHTAYKNNIKTYGKHPRSIAINEHSVIGKAYLCPLGLIPASKNSTTHVKINETPLI